MTQPDPEPLDLPLDVVCASYEQQISALARQVAILTAQLAAKNDVKADDAG